MAGPNDIARFEALLKRHLSFYEDLHNRVRRPKTAAQRKFQDVAWGKEEPETEHERAYIYYLDKIGRSPSAEKLKTYPLVDEDESLPPGLRPVSNATGMKWDASAENMKSWKPWHD